MDALATAITHLIDVRIARDQAGIGAHERAAEAQQNLLGALWAAFELKSNPPETEP